MIDIQLIRKQPELVRQALKNRGEDGTVLEDILAKDENVRRTLSDLESCRAQINNLSRNIGSFSQELKVLAERLKTSQDAGLTPEVELYRKQIQEYQELVDRDKNSSRGYSERIGALQPVLVKLQKELEERLLYLPNIPHSSVPVGMGEEGNVAVRTGGTRRQFSFTPRPHWEIGEKLDIIDFERGVKLSGTRFYVLKGAGSRLQRALINFMLDLHTKEHGYTEIYPPFMVKSECLVSTGSLPRFADNLYHDAEEDYWFVPTAEVPLTNLHRDEVLDSLPLYYSAYTACFRREKMAAGKETRGLKRGHQFDKVELYKLTEPDKSFAELEKLVQDAESVVQRLDLPYKIKLLCTGELGFASAKSYDIDVYAPGIDDWLEVSSCSNCTDFQARRARIRYRPAPGARPQFVHTLNGSGLALPRIVIALLENYQQADGTVVIPPALRPYMGGMDRIGSG